MTKFGSQIIENETVLLDNNEYYGTIFKNCTLIYAGGNLVMEDCEYFNCPWEFAGAAKRTIGVFRDIMTGQIPDDMREVLKKMVGVSDAPKPQG